MKISKICHPRYSWIAIIIGLLTAISVSSKGQDFSFNVEKTGKGSPVIFIPGMACDGSVWDASVAEWSRSYECHVLTLPGFAGQKPINVENGFSPKMSDEIVRYIKSQKLKNPVLVGHSLGGFLTLDIISSQPELISKAIIVDGLPFLGAVRDPNATEESMKGQAKQMQNMFQNTDAKQFEAQQRMTLNTMITDSVDIENALEWGLKSDRSTVSQAMYELYTTDLRDEMTQVKIPVLVLGAYIEYTKYGLTKEMIYGNYANQFQHLKGAEIVLSDIGKHFIMLDDQEFFQQQVGGFLARQSN